MGNLPDHIALVYDRVNKWGGAERVLLALHDLFPQAPLYTSVYDSQKAFWAKVFPRVIPSFLNQLPYIKNHHELVPFLTPLAFECFNLSKYQAVISVTSADAKGIVTPPNTFHLCYCLTPTRYLWSHYQHHYDSIPTLLKPLSLPWFKYLKTWDLIAARRPDSYVAISRTVQERITTYYQTKSFVIYPPVETDFFKTISNSPISNLPEKYFLYIGRFVSYKHPQIVIQSFNQTGLPLVVVGSGSLNWGNPSLTSNLKKFAGQNIRFFNSVSDSQLAYLYQHCQAVIFFHEEDFGIIPVEAMAAGKPVIGINRGGVSETVIPGLTGELADLDSCEALSDIVNNFNPQKYDAYFIQNYAQKFSRKRFLTKFAKVMATEWKKYKTTYTY